MRGWGWVLVVVVAGLMAGQAEALVLCAARKGTAPKEGAAPKVRTACKAKEVQLDPAALGLQGPAGTNGANGADGAAGAPGLSGLEVMTADSANVILNNFQTATATANCSSGKKVIAGGVEFIEVVSGSATTMGAQVSKPVTGSDPEGWTGTMSATFSEDWKARVYAICATVAP